VLHLLVEEIRAFKIDKYIKNSKEYDQLINLKDIDSNYSLQCIKEKLDSKISELISSNWILSGEKIEHFQTTVLDKEIIFNLGPMNEISYLPGLYSAKSMMKNFSKEDFLFIFFSLFYERTIIFVSESKRLISLTM